MLCRTPAIFNASDDYLLCRELPILHIQRQRAFLPAKAKGELLSLSTVLARNPLRRSPYGNYFFKGGGIAKLFIRPITGGGERQQGAPKLLPRLLRPDFGLSPKIRGGGRGRKEKEKLLGAAFLPPTTLFFSVSKSEEGEENF